MIMNPVPGMKAVVTATGDVRLLSPTTGSEIRLEGKDLAMWIALLQHDGHVDDTATTLAGYWGENLSNVQCDLWAWAHDLWSSGALMIGSSDHT